MRYVALCLLGVLFLGQGSTVRGDIPPPPPPKGKKYVTIDHEVLLAKNVTGYVFVEHLSGFGPKDKFRKLALNDSKPTAITTAGRREGILVYMVPESVAKKFDKDEALFKACKDSGASDKPFPVMFFSHTAFLNTSDKRERVTWTHTITAIDDSKGPKVTTKGDGEEPKFESDDTEEPTNRPTGNLVFAGLAATLGFVFLGVWLFRRR